MNYYEFSEFTRIIKNSLEFLVEPPKEVLGININSKEFIRITKNYNEFLVELPKEFLGCRKNR